MFTNTYLPHVGGVARSVSSCVKAYRELGHETLVFTPEFEEGSPEDEGVVYLPAITNFNNSGFSVRLPSPLTISDQLDAFEPDVIHSHHPFLLGDAALRVAYAREIPLVFTHHTLYERYTDYLPFHGEFAQKAAATLATEYANACDMVFAPSESLANLIVRRGVKTPVTTQPTGVDIERFAGGDGHAFRREHGIGRNRFLIGHVGRLAHEKNLDYLCDAVSAFLKSAPEATLAMVGGGDQEDSLRARFEEHGVTEQALMVGKLQGEALMNAYAAFDVFAFSSQSETQGLVLVEAMASGSPVVALDGPGVRDVLFHEENGLLLQGDAAPERFTEGLARLMKDRDFLANCGQRAAEVARGYELKILAKRALDRYGELIRSERHERRDGLLENFESFAAALEAEWELLKARASAAVAGVGLVADDEGKNVELK
ncbi:glycosyltransferase [Pelagicoccus sp. SDUM812003]|uniref:glycosyltransferase n=1 Tax=Pelagicoccus sp. SDUM812003 TaxID=3041267 RepID=UPI00280FEE09|nr:glycosyltransferase [Pelagicoccus sp. SDUM812003]MDQ8204327.1 glycosyltransferase [Pelagicoccus sp. SDUM812003]